MKAEREPMKVSDHIRQATTPSPISLSVQTPTGKTVKLRLEALHDAARVTLVEIPDLKLKAPTVSGLLSAPPKGSPRGVTHALAIRSRGKTIPVGFDQTAARKIQQALDQLQGQIDAREDVKLRKLIKTRQALQDKLGAVREDTEEQSNQAWERGDETETFRIREKGEQKARAVVRKIQEFDRQHPEVAEHLSKERDDRTRRHMWD